MKKSVSLAVRVLAAVLAYAALLMLTPAAFAAEAGSLDNFKATETYTEGQFTDVPKAWYAASVKTAYELGLMKGVGSGQFNPTGNISIMETIVLACRIHKTYYTGDGSFVQGKPWYQVYLDYAVANGIIVKDQYPDYQAKATRAVFAQVLAKALPAEALPVINRVDDDAIPDVSSSLPYAAPIYQLYRAGVLTGGTDGAFSPAARIARSEAAAIAARMARPAERRSVTLTVCAAKGHTWDAGKTTQVVTCVVDGIKTYTCTVCGVTKTETIKCKGSHTWVAATYTTPKTCGVCGATEGTVRPKEPTSMVMKLTEMTLHVNATGQLYTVIAPAGATSALTWTSSQPGIATVDSSGKVTAKKAGSTLITATTANGVTAKCLVTVIPNTSIEVAAVKFTGLNSVNGVDMDIYWRNNSGKTINYLYFYVSVYDLNGRKLADTITKNTTFTCYGSGPLAPSGVENYYYHSASDTFATVYQNSETGEYHLGWKLTDSSYRICGENLPFTYRRWSWDAIMYNGMAASIKLNKIKVEYADGTTEVINNPTVKTYTNADADGAYLASTHYGESAPAFDHFVEIAKTKGQYDSGRKEYSYMYWETQSGGTTFRFRLNYNVAKDELSLTSLATGTGVVSAVTLTIPREITKCGVKFTGDFEDASISEAVSISALASIDPVNYTDETEISFYHYSGPDTAEWKKESKELVELTLKTMFGTFTKQLGQGTYTLHGLGFLQAK